MALRPTCELILDHMPKEAEPEEQLKEDRKEREGAEKEGNGRCVEALRSQGMIVREDP